MPLQKNCGPSWERLSTSEWDQKGKEKQNGWRIYEGENNCKHKILYLFEHFFWVSILLSSIQKDGRELEPASNAVTWGRGSLFLNYNTD